MQSTDIPGKIVLPFGASAGGSYIRTVPVASQIGVVPGAASYTDGFPPLNFQQIALGGLPPAGQDVNGILFAISALSRWFSSGAPIPWDSAFSAAVGGYPKGAIVQSVTTFGNIWVSTAENNVTNPDAAGAGWQLLSTFLGISNSGSAKAWVKYDGVGQVVYASFNVTSVTRISTGLYRVNFITAFGSTQYVGVGNSDYLLIPSGGFGGDAGVINIATGNVGMLTGSCLVQNSGSYVQDPIDSRVFLAFFGA